MRRQLLIQELYQGIHGIVRIDQGISRLAGREDLGRRFRPILQRTLRQLDAAAEEGNGTETGNDAEGVGTEAPEAPEESAPEETTA